MTDPSASFVSSKRRRPTPYEEVEEFFRVEAEYNQPGREYPAANHSAKLKLNKMCADIALDYYNNKSDTKFVFLVETFDSYSVGDAWGLWIDCCFKATDGSVIKHFAAEIQYLHESGPDLTYFKILEGKTEVGCCNCTHASHAKSVKKDRSLDKKFCELCGQAKHPKRCRKPSCQEEAPVDLTIGGEDQLGLKTPANPAAQLKFNKMCADVSLDYYNIKNTTKFEFVEDELLFTVSYSDPLGIWIYCCFNAKDDASINHFCADIRYEHQSGPDVMLCKILEGEASRSSNCTHGSPAMSKKEDRNVEIVENVHPAFAYLRSNFDQPPLDWSTWKPYSPDYAPYSPDYVPVTNFD